MEENNMQKYKLSNEYISSCNNALSPSYPKYTTQVINLANQNAGGTRPNVVGQLSEMLPEYLRTTYAPTLEGWKQWYLERYPNAIEIASEKIWDQVQNLKNCMDYINKDMVITWTEDLVFNKTFNGLYYQSAILKKISEIEGLPYRLATPIEEALNIDGYVGSTAYQIKPDTYDIMAHQVHENIDCKIIRYTKKKDGIVFEY